MADVHAIPFVRVVDGIYEVTPAAIDFWSTVGEGVSILAVVGKYRTGKSFLMNRCLLEGKGGFNVGDTVNSCTKGIWVYPKVLELGTGMKKRRVVIMDTEGIGALDTDSNHDAKIFALALLLSSQFVYNSMGSIDESALDTLSLVLKVSKELRVGAVESNGGNQQQDANESLSNFMPNFKWVVRDFVLRLVGLDGKTISSDEYLENALQDNMDNEEKNAIRTAIRDCFQTRSCTTLVRPCVDEESLQQLDTLDESAMRPNFIKQLGILKDELLNHAPTKKLMGHDISGKMLITLAESFCDAINNGAVPVIRNSWDLMCEVKDRDLMEQSFTSFVQTTESWSESAISSNAMTSALANLQQECIITFETKCMGGKKESLSQKLKILLEKRAMEIIQTVESNLENLIDKILSDTREKIEGILPTDLEWCMVLCTVESAYRSLSHHTPDNTGALSTMSSRLCPLLLEWGGLIAENNSGGFAIEEKELLEKEVLNLKNAHEVEMKTIKEAHEKLTNDWQLHGTERDEQLNKKLKIQIDKYSEMRNTLTERDTQITSLEEEGNILRAKLCNNEDRDENDNELQNSYLKEIGEKESLAQQVTQLSTTLEDIRREKASVDCELADSKRSYSETIEELNLHAQGRLDALSSQVEEEQNKMKSEMSTLSDTIKAERNNVESLQAEKDSCAKMHERQLAKQMTKYSSLENELLSSKAHTKSLETNMQVQSQEFSKFANGVMLKQQNIELSHKNELAQLRDEMTIQKSDVYDELRIKEGQLEQIKERHRQNKRILEETQVEMNENKRLRSDYEVSCKQLIKSNAENEFLRHEKTEKTQTLNEYIVKTKQLEKEKIEAERKLVIECFKNKLN